MSSASAIPDTNPTRAQLRLVVLGQWIRAGLALARGARAERGLVGGAVALWRIIQAVRLAIQLAQRLSELQGALARGAPQTAPAQPSALGFDLPSDTPSCSAAFLRSALGELAGMIRDAQGLAPVRRLTSDAAEPSSAAAAPQVPHRRLPSRPGLPPDRPPKPERSRARRRRPRARRALKPTPTPIAAPAIGRRPLAAPLGARAFGPG